MTEATIGKLLFPNQHQEEATLHCCSPEPSTLAIHVLDSLGRPYKLEKLQLPAGDNEVSLSLGHLPSGEYNAWISLGEKTVIRSFNIQPRNKAATLLKRLLAPFL